MKLLSSLLSRKQFRGHEKRSKMHKCFLLSLCPHSLCCFLISSEPTSFIWHLGTLVRFACFHRIIVLCDKAVILFSKAVERSMLGKFTSVSNQSWSYSACDSRLACGKMLYCAWPLPPTMSGMLLNLKVSWLSRWLQDSPLLPFLSQGNCFACHVCGNLFSMWSWANLVLPVFHYCHSCWVAKMLLLALEFYSCPFVSVTYGREGMGMWACTGNWLSITFLIIIPHTLTTSFLALIDHLVSSCFSHMLHLGCACGTKS